MAKALVREVYCGVYVLCFGPSTIHVASWCSMIRPRSSLKYCIQGRQTTKMQMQFARTNVLILFSLLGMLQESSASIEDYECLTSDGDVPEWIENGGWVSLMVTSFNRLPISIA